MTENWTTLKENWGTIQYAFTAYGPRVLFVATLLVGVYAVAKLMKAYVTSRKKPIQKDPDVQFLEGALDDDAPRKGNADYTYAEFQRDLHDKGLTFEEIYEKCGGVFPKKPEPSTLHHSEGGHLLKGQDGGQSPNGPDGQCSDRTKELQMWFEERGKSSPLKKLVSPPPAPHTVIHKIYTRGRR